jgi:protein-S-isoprenylcysteine O-methyltransferase Ste14
MRPLAYVWPYALAFWSAFVWTFAPEMLLNRRSRRMASTQDASSLLLVVVFQVTAMAAAFGIAWIGRFGVLAQQRLWFWAGLATMVTGSLLRRHCFRMLGSSFTAVVLVTPGQQIVERGAYRWVRHPSYTAGGLVLGGLALALGNWVGLLVMLSAIVIAYGYRVRIEERALVATLGEPYRAYMQRTKRFIPLLI